MKAVALLFSVLTISCSAGVRNNSQRVDLGRIPIGAVPKDMSMFKSSDCQETEGRLDFSDCSAVDGEGRRYVFFDGALSRVSAQQNEVAISAVLPAGMRFGDPVEFAKNRAESQLGLRFDRASVQGRMAYTSDFSLRSDAGILFSMEIIGDNDGKLVEVIQRTDF
jgi:hypothetical protein